MRNIGIFISSTFTDMQGERDYIKKIIVPRLQDYFRNSDINIYTIDLRWGVDTASVDFDEKREEKVLDICFNTIRNHRPYFVGLIGNRYGWIPTKERIEGICSHFSGDDDFMREYTDGRSVTEMEMLFGALGKSDLIPHSFFFFRSDGAYSQMPADVRARFEDNDPKKQYRLQQLKNKIRTTFQDNTDGHIFDYAPKYDPTKKSLTGFEEFGEKLINALIDDISLEYEVLKPDSIRLENDLYFKKKADRCCGRHKIISELTAFIRDFNPWINNPTNGCVLCGISGCGKTTIISKVYSNLVSSQTDLKYLILTHIVGLTPDSLSYWEMIERWNHELENELNVHYEEQDIVLRFEKLLMYAVVNGFKPVVFIDTYDKFQTNDLIYKHLPSSDDICQLLTSLSFIPRFIPLICNSIKEYLDDEILSNPYFRIYDIEDYSYEDACELVRYSLKEKELSEKALNLLLSRRKPDKKPSYSQPIWINIAMALLDEMGGFEFEEVMTNSASRDDQKIDNYICNFISSFPSEPEELFRMFVSLGMRYFSKDIIRTTTELLAASKFGVSEYDIKQFMGDKWNPLDFSYIIKWLGPFIENEPITNSWKLSHDILKHSLENDVDLDAINNFKRQYVQSILSSACYDLRILKECISIIVEIGDTRLFRKVMHIFDFMYEIMSMSAENIASAVLRAAGKDGLASIIAKSLDEFKDDDKYSSCVYSFLCQLTNEYKAKGISYKDYFDFYCNLHNNINISIRIDYNGYWFNSILRDIYKVLSDGGNSELYSEYIVFLKERYLKFGAGMVVLTGDPESFYYEIADYITQNVILRIKFDQFSEDKFSEAEKIEYCSIVKQRLNEIRSEIDWLILLGAHTRKEVISNGELLSSILSSMYTDVSYLEEYTNIQEKISGICREIKEKSHSQYDLLNGITNPYAQFEIGWYYYYESTHQDKHISYIWFSIAAENNQPLAEFWLAEMYYKGDGVNQNVNKAVELYIRSARHGNRSAQRKLGTLYEDGIGVPKDYSQAMQWYMLSAQQGEGKAQSDLGDFYFYGIGTAIDYIQAFNWYFKAALNMIPYSRYRLGVMLMEGIGVKKDKDKALFWLNNVAKREEYEPALEYLEKYESEHPDIQNGKNDAVIQQNTQRRYALMDYISTLKYNVNCRISAPDDSADFATFMDYMILYCINSENLGVRYQYKSHFAVSHCLSVCAERQFTDGILRQLKQLYLLSRKLRVIKSDDDSARLFEINLLSYFIENGMREDARRLALEKFELTLRFSSSYYFFPDAFTSYSIFVIARKLSNSWAEQVAIYEMTQKDENSEKLPADYEYASPFYNGEALVCNQGQWYYINHSGERVRNFYCMSLDEYPEDETYGGLAFHQRVHEIETVCETGSAGDKFKVAEILDEKINDYHEIAAKLYESAAQAGHPGAQLSIGFMYYKGRGVAKDQQMALHWFTKGAEQGNAMCKYWLKEMGLNNIEDNI